MKTNIIELSNKLLHSLTDIFSGDIYKGLNIDVSQNTKKVRMGSASITIKISEKDKSVDTTIYIVEKRKGVLVLFANNKTHDIVFNNYGLDSINKSQAYILKYIKRSVDISVMGMMMSTPDTTKEEDHE